MRSNKNQNRQDSITTSSQNSFGSNNNFNRRKENERNYKEGRSIRCHKCDGFRHFQAECATFLKEEIKV